MKWASNLKWILFTLFPLISVEPRAELQALPDGVARRSEPDNLHVRLVHRPPLLHHGHHLCLGAVSHRLAQFSLCHIKINFNRRIPPSNSCGPFQEYSSVVDIGFWTSADYNPVLFSPPFMALVVIILLYVFMALLTRIDNIL